MLKFVEGAFGSTVKLRGVTYYGASSPIVSGYSFRAADGSECYGLAEDGRVTVLGIIQRHPRAHRRLESADALIKIVKEYDLDLVTLAALCASGVGRPAIPAYVDRHRPLTACPRPNAGPLQESVRADLWVRASASKRDGEASWTQGTTRWT